MSQKILRALILTLAMPAFSDEILFSGAVQCDEKSHAFTLEGTVATDSRDTSYFPAGNFNFLEPGENKFNCKIGKSRISAKIKAVEPGAGNGEGAGWVEITTIKLNEKEISNIPKIFNDLSSGGGLTKVELRENGDGTVELTKCTADEWNWDAGYINRHCQASVAVANNALKSPASQAGTPPAGDAP